MKSNLLKFLLILQFLSEKCSAQDYIEVDETDDARLYMGPINKFNRTRQWVHCAGTLIGDGFVLTAASCFDIRDEKSDLSYMSGRTTFFPGGPRTSHPVREVFVHPQYKANRPLENNIAIFRIEIWHGGPVFQPRTIGNILPNRFCTVMGWKGHQMQTPEEIPLRMFPIVINNATMCNETSSQAYCTRQTDLISTFESCGGLRGAPVFCGDGKLSGIVVRDHFCVGSNPVGASFISVGDFKDWIDGVMNTGESVKVSFNLLLGIIVKILL